MSYLLSALSFLLELAFSALATLFVLRLLAEACRADFNNPLSQFVYRYTNPVLAPARRVLPNWRRINLAALLVAWLLMLLKRAMLFALLGILPGVAGLLLLSLADLLDFVLVFYLVLIFAWSLMSMFQVDRRQPVLRLMGSLVEPLLRPLRGKLVIGGLDFSPWAVMIVLMLLRLLVVAPLTHVGTALALGM
ncbi:YggT family protein [Dyella tabacisoli]|uniref:YggT family protein n=1 Tax=Dyella tabacisoli TaxID=2282381 RepID=A0A369UPK5_9GAMM|nr:YggT family protein [Dyella tabacisoli]RDD82692.1 YggT family protein [Dyella tabacisoli]